MFRFLEITKVFAAIREKPREFRFVARLRFFHGQACTFDLRGAKRKAVTLAASPVFTVWQGAFIASNVPGVDNRRTKKNPRTLAAFRANAKRVQAGNVAKILNADALLLRFGRREAKAIFATHFRNV